MAHQSDAHHHHATGTTCGVASGPPAPDPVLVQRAWRALVLPGAVHEVRLPRTRRRGPCRFFGVASGYFDDEDAFVDAVRRIGGGDAEGVYVTLNPVRAALLARADNRLRDGAPGATADADVDVLRRLLVDLDPVRPSHVSATDDERAAAIARREVVRGALGADFGWPEPEAQLETGNGAALIYRLGDLPNDVHHAGLLRAALAALDVCFSDGVVVVDASTHNPSRLVKIPGTVAAKGDHAPRLGRPWRRATGAFNPCPVPVPLARLQDMAGLAPCPIGGAHPPPDAAGGLDVRRVLAERGIGFVEKPRPWGVVLRLDRCLTSADHADGAAVLEFPSGALAYRCLHSRCAGTEWADARAALGLPGNAGGRPAGVSPAGPILLLSGAALRAVRQGRGSRGR
jgi:hypothetical protein